MIDPGPEPYETDAWAEGEGRAELADMDREREPRPGEDDIPSGESVVEKLRLLQTWLIEDSDLPEVEAEDFNQALEAALEALESR